ncbi:MFS transporter [Acidiphilium sp. AL]|uniref:MFS transporter n=1 Tax=Acidiphilium sp. AL TaxID=2871704 RepID=UPI0021CAF733|nr:MFS transporter [Acidiphilium sp. AL]MCU4160386.1 MFS transporter [Acidiphilium sp. AL]
MTEGDRSHILRDENLLARLDRIPINRTIGWLIVLLGLVWILEAFDIGIIAPVILLLKSNWHLQPKSVGLIASSGTFGIVLGLLPAGRLADIYGRKGVLIAGICTFSIFTMVSADSSNYYELAIFRFIAGLGQGAVFPVPYLLLSEFVNKKWRGTAVGLSNSLLGLAYALNTLAGAWVLRAFPSNVAWRVLLLIGAAPILIVPVIWKFLPESPRILLKKGRPDAVQAFVERLENESGLPHDTTLVDEKSLRVLQVTEGRRVSVLDLLKRPYLQRCFVSFSALLSPFVVFYVITIYGPTILHRMGATKHNALLYTSALIVLGIISNILVGLVGDKFGRRATHFVVMTIAAISTAALGLQDVSRGVVILAAAFTWFFVYAGFPPSKLYMAEQFPTRLRATGSMFGESVARFLTGVVLVYFIPILLNTVGLTRLFVILALLTELCLIPILFMGTQTSGISVEETGTDVSVYSTSRRSPP